MSIAHEVEASSVCSDQKRRGKGWGEDEEITLIQEVLDREGILFGDLKGCGAKNIHRQRIDEWQAVTDVLNTRFSAAKRDCQEVKKKYFNLKQRAKLKIDHLKLQRTRTGGGPAPPQLTQTEEVLLQALDGKPSIHGLESGIDTDENPMNRGVLENTTSQEGSSTSTLNSTGTSTHNSTSNSTSNNSSQSKMKVLSEDKKSVKKIKNVQDDATVENTLKDTERLDLEMKKLRAEISLAEKKPKKLDTEIELLQYKSLYYQMKLQTEFGVSLLNVTHNEQ